jgi:hypothetical protein
MTENRRCTDERFLDSHRQSTQAGTFTAIPGDIGSE